MPTYDYVCDACGHEFEEFQSITAEPLVQCPSCKKKKLRRLIGTGGAVIFKGAGFYQTDYRSESYKKGAKAEKDAHSISSSSNESKSSESKSNESKPSDSKPKSSSSDAKS